MKKVVFRADSSELIGSGHITRCRTLARELEARGMDIIFICLNLKGNLISELKNEFKVISIDQWKDYKITKIDKVRNKEAIYSESKQCGQIRDAKECISAMEINKVGDIEYIIVDHYGLDAKWETYIKEEANKKSGCKVVVIDDLGINKHNCEIYVNQNYILEHEKKRYVEKVPKECEIKLGPKYALLSKEYEQLHKMVPTRKHLGRIMVYFGGVDEYNYTIKTIKAMMAWDLRNIELDVVLGQIKNSEKDIIKLIKKRGRVNVHKNLPSLAGLMIRADLSIGAGGSTTWERACMGLPSLVIATAENQFKTSNNLNDKGYHYLIGNMNNVTEADIRRKIRWFRQNKMVEKSSQLTDGKGASRIGKLLTHGV